MTNLSLWRTFPVRVPATPASHFGGSDATSSKLASYFGARYIVEGSVRKGGKPSAHHRAAH